MEIRHMDITFRGIDSWNRPVYKVVNKEIYFGSVNKLFSDDARAAEVDEYFRANLDELEFFGDCRDMPQKPKMGALNIKKTIG